MRRFTLMLALVLAVLTPAAVMAQALSADDVARLSDEEERRLLLERLTSDETAAPEAAFHTARAAFLLQQELGQAQSRDGQIAASIPALIALPGEAWVKPRARSSKSRCARSSCVITAARSTPCRSARSTPSRTTRAIGRS